MSILAHLRDQPSAAARHAQRGPRRWLRLGGRSLLVIPLAVVALGGLASAAIQTLDADHRPSLKLASWGLESSS